MAMFTNTVVWILIASCVNISYGQRDLNIVNPDYERTNNVLLLYDTTETVVCMLTNSTANVPVIFGFSDQDLTDKTNITRTRKVMFIREGVLVINVTMTFKVTSAMYGENLLCQLEDGYRVSRKIEMYFPPIVIVSGVGQMPSSITNKVEMHCDTVSLPDLEIQWFINDVPLDQTVISHTEAQNCLLKFDTSYGVSSDKYLCRSNMTLYNITKENIGSKVECAFIYLNEEHHRTTVIKSLDYYYEPDDVSVVNNVVSVVTESTDGMVEMTCTTSAANPEPALQWSDQYLGVPRLNTSQFPVSVIKTAYNGHIVMQTVQISVNKDMNGKTYYCCADTPYIATVTDVCGHTDIQVAWLTGMVTPSMDDYRVYVGDDLTIPCQVDSNPISMIEWYKANSKLVDNNNDKRNVLELSLTNAQKSDSGTYRCTANIYEDENNELLHTSSKSVNVHVRDLPPLPFIYVIDDSTDAPSISIETPSEISEVSQTFYLQYKKETSTYWMEIDQKFSDSLPGQRETYYFDFTPLGLPDGKYHLRMKSMSSDGMVTYTDAQVFNVKSDDDEEEMVTKASRTNAILISVFVTVGVFLVIIVAGVCILKKRGGS